MMADMIDPLAQAQAAALAKASGASGACNVRPIRADVVERPSVHCVSSSEFLADVDMPSWVVAGIVQSGYLYALTAPTNHGKTAVSLVMAMCVAAGKSFAGLDVKRGNVLILCGENQDGFRLRMRATLQSLDLSPADIDGCCWVYPQAGGLITILAGIQDDAQAMGELSLVLVDTSVSFFDGADENDNMAALQHALVLRELTKLPGAPAVVANCHPTGSASEEGCVPRGGSAFLNEIDTNLTVWADAETSKLHWMRKKRGPDFDPILFEYKAVTLEQFGNKVPTVVALPITEDREAAIKKKKREEENRVMFEMNQSDDWTFSDMARACLFIDKNGNPIKSKVHRVLNRLKEVKLVDCDRRKGWYLTAKGKEEAKYIH